MGWEAGSSSVPSLGDPHWAPTDVLETGRCRAAASISASQQNQQLAQLSPSQSCSFRAAGIPQPGSFTDPCSAQNQCHPCSLVRLARGSRVPGGAVPVLGLPLPSKHPSQSLDCHRGQDTRTPGHGPALGQHCGSQGLLSWLQGLSSCQPQLHGCCITTCSLFHIFSCSLTPLQKF